MVLGAKGNGGPGSVGSPSSSLPSPPPSPPPPPPLGSGFPTPVLPGGAAPPPASPDGGCKPGASSGKGCPQHPTDNDEDDDDECDASSGIGCDCGGPEPPTSPLACIKYKNTNNELVTKLKSKSEMRDEKKKKKKKKLIKVKIPKGKHKKDDGKPKEPSDCDWNPFTNLLYFLFCIILKILKPIITAPFLLELSEEDFQDFHPDVSSTSAANTLAIKNTHNSIIDKVDHSLALMHYPPMIQQANQFFQSTIEETSILNMIEMVLPAANIPSNILSAKTVSMPTMPTMPTTPTPTPTTTSLPSIPTFLTIDPASFVEVQASVQSTGLFPGSGCKDDCNGHGKCSEEKSCLCDQSYIGATCTKRIPPYPPNDSIPPLYGHSAVPVNRGHSVLVFGGKGRDKSLNDYSGDDLYYNDLWWFQAHWDVKLSRFLPTGMLWLPVHNLAGPKPSPRAEHSADVTPFGATGAPAMIIFGGYDGTGLKGYKNDMYAVINIEQDQHELDVINDEIRTTVDIKTKRASDNSLTVLRGFFYNKLLEKTSTDSCIKEKEKRKHDLSTEDFDDNIEELCERYVEEKKSKIPKTYDPKYSMPWDAEKIYGTWKYEEGPLSRWYGIGKPWSRQPTWVHVNPQGIPPSPRKQHGSAVVGDLFFIIGGFGISAIDMSEKDGSDASLVTDYLNDLHIFNTRTMEWLRTGYKAAINNEGVECIHEKSPKSEECQQSTLKKFINDPNIIHGTPPSPRAGFTLTPYLFNLVLYGGVAGHSMGFPDQDLYVLDTGCRYGAQGTLQYGKILCDKGPSGLPTKLRWRTAKAVGSMPTPRFGHVSLPTSAQEIKGYQPYESRKGMSTKMLVVGGYGAGGSSGNWRLRKRSQGYRMDKSVLDLGIPFIEEIYIPPYNMPPIPTLPLIPEVPDMPGVENYSPHWFKPVAPIDIPKVVWPGGNAPSSGTSFVVQKQPINSEDSEGNNNDQASSGPSGPFVNKQQSDTPIRMTIRGKNFKGDVGVTIGNAKHGPFPCKNVVVKDSTELNCELTAGVGTDLDIIVHGNNQHALPGNKLFSYDPPRIIATVPSFVIDFCWPRELKSGKGTGKRTHQSVVGSLCPMRGPILLLGTNFG
jgi:hypothetical protein